MMEGVRKLKQTLAGQANDKFAGEMKAYLKGQFDFFGIQAQNRRAHSTAVFKKYPVTHVTELLRWSDELWNLPQREFQLCAVDLLQKHRGLLGPKNLGKIQKFIQEKSWWDTVDMLAVNVLGPLIARHPSLLSNMDRWIEGSLWLQRSALLYQLKFKHNTDWPRLTRYIRQTKGSREFFIQKAIGWTLREHSKSEPDRVLKFIRGESLAPLSTREGLKWIRTHHPKLLDFG